MIIKVDMKEVIWIVYSGEFNIYVLPGHVHIYADHSLCTVIFSLILFVIIILIYILINSSLLYMLLSSEMLLVSELMN